jgi:PTH2 family peptidyl-tRNA hydrolase
MELRLYIAIRKDLNIPKAKFGVQIAHAALSVFLECWKHKPELAINYYNNGSQPKIVLEIPNEKKLIALEDEAKKLGHITCQIIDEGRTIFTSPTLTCVGIGPLWFPEETQFMKRIRLYHDE